MEHSSHAHPPPNEPPKETREASAAHASYITSLSNTSSFTESSNARRLALRNVGFSVSASPIRRMSPFFGNVPIKSQGYSPLANKENRDPMRNSQDVFDGGTLGSAVNILQEIHNPPRSTHETRRPQVEPPSYNPRGYLGDTSWYNPTSRNCSPYSQSPSPGVRGLRTISGNQQMSPPEILPESSQRPQGATRVRIGSESYNASQYIDYLEHQLVLAQAKYEAATSTEAKKARSTKMKSLSIENKNLRAEVEELQRKYDVRVQTEAEKRLEFHTRLQEEVEKRLELEAEMKDRLDALESESELKDAKTREVEWELECTKNKARDSESLQEVNQDLERRIDMLTHLLVQTPTRNTASSASSSPSKRTSRPRTIALPRMPPSPGGARLSLTTVSETAPWQLPASSPPSRNLRSSHFSSSFVTSPDSLGLDDSEALISPNSPRRASRPSLQQYRGSFNLHSAPSVSRPTSFLSTSSYDTAPGESPEPQELEDIQNFGRKRQMRRFTAGSKSLKPLVLPSTNSVQSLPTSAPAHLSVDPNVDHLYPARPEDTARQTLSRLERNPPSSSLTPVRRPISTAEQAHDQALEALEGKTKSGTVSPTPPPSSTASSTETERNITSRIQAWEAKTGSRLKFRSLQTELEDAASRRSGRQVSAGASNDPFHSRPYSSMHTTPEPSQIAIGLEPPSSHESASDMEKGIQPQLQVSDTVSKLGANIPSLPETAHLRNESGSVVSTSQQMHDIFTRLPHLLATTRQNPWSLVRHILMTAWSAGKDTLAGRFGWWILGLVYRPCRRRSMANYDESCTADESSDPETMYPDHARRRSEPPTDRSSWSCPHSRHASGKLTTERKRNTRDYGGTWLSPPHMAGQEKELPPFLPLGHHQEPQRFPCSDCTEPSSRRTLRLWFQFSFAIVLAIGVAIKNGPGVLITETPPDQPLQGHSSQGDEVGFAGDNQSQSSSKHRDRDFSGRTSKTDNSIADSGYGSIMFAETLGPEHFQRHG